LELLKGKPNAAAETLNEPQYKGKNKIAQVKAAIEELQKGHFYQFLQSSSHSVQRSQFIHERHRFIYLHAICCGDTFKMHVQMPQRARAHTAKRISFSKSLLIIFRRWNIQYSRKLSSVYGRNLIAIVATIGKKNPKTFPLESYLKMPKKVRGRVNFLREAFEEVHAGNQEREQEAIRPDLAQAFFRELWAKEGELLSTILYTVKRKKGVMVRRSCPDSLFFQSVIPVTPNRYRAMKAGSRDVGILNGIYIKTIQTSEKFGYMKTGNIDWFYANWSNLNSYCNDRIRAARALIDRKQGLVRRNLMVQTHLSSKKIRSSHGLCRENE